MLKEYFEKCRRIRYWNSSIHFVNIYKSHTPTCTSYIMNITCCYDSSYLPNIYITCLPHFAFACNQKGALLFVCRKTRDIKNGNLFQRCIGSLEKRSFIQQIDIYQTHFNQTNWLVFKLTVLEAIDAPSVHLKRYPHYH